MIKRMPVADLEPGDFILTVGSREINSTFVALHSLPPGSHLTGPRGGRYRLTPAGAAQCVRLETYAADRPVVNRHATATIQVMEP